MLKNPSLIFFDLLNPISECESQEKESFSAYSYYSNTYIYKTVSLTCLEAAKFGRIAQTI